MSSSPGPEHGPGPGLRLAHFAVRALRITASTVALVALVRQQWIPAVCFGVGWLLILRAQRWMPPETDPATPSASDTTP
ncbi:MAG: hypothetical protein ACOVNL_07655 [Prochlorococcaceae cyanobacterium]|jgi:hypothetical protein